MHAELLPRRRTREWRMRCVLASCHARHSGTIVHLSRWNLRRREEQGLPGSYRRAGQTHKEPSPPREDAFVSFHALYGDAPPVPVSYTHLTLPTSDLV